MDTSDISQTALNLKEKNSSSPNYWVYSPSFPRAIVTMVGGVPWRSALDLVQVSLSVSFVSIYTV